MAWWIWVLSGLVLLAAEVTTRGLIIPPKPADVGSIIAAAMNVIQARDGAAPTRPAGPAR